MRSETLASSIISEPRSAHPCQSGHSGSAALRLFASNHTRREPSAWIELAALQELVVEHFVELDPALLEHRMLSVSQFRMLGTSVDLLKRRLSSAE